MINGAALSRRHTYGETHMKKLMSSMLGLTLLAGTATVAFAQTNTNQQKAAKKKGKKGKKGTDTAQKKAQSN
jgi:hypothetical protein